MTITEKKYSYDGDGWLEDKCECDFWVHPGEHQAEAFFLYHIDGEGGHGRCLGAGYSKLGDGYITFASTQTDFDLETTMKLLAQDAAMGRLLEAHIGASSTEAHLLIFHSVNCSGSGVVDAPCDCATAETESIEAQRTIKE